MGEREPRRTIHSEFTAGQLLRQPAVSEFLQSSRIGSRGLSAATHGLSTNKKSPPILVRTSGLIVGEMVPVGLTGVRYRW